MALILLLTVRPSRAQDNGLEYAVKATYLYKFVPFVGWPQGVFSNPTSPVVICVMADQSFTALVERAVAGQTMEGHPFDVMPLQNAANADPCQVLFIPSTEPVAVAQALAAVRSKPVLTVTETTGSAPRGIINFVAMDNRVRFEIDLAEAARDNLVISSKLLSIAVSVYPLPTQKSP